jgi:hypothetical protein
LNNLLLYSKTRIFSDQELCLAIFNTSAEKVLLFLGKDICSQQKKKVEKNPVFFKNCKRNKFVYSVLFTIAFAKAVEMTFY